MAHLIDKDALVAEIENWKQHTLECGYKGQGDYEDGNKQGRLDTCDKFLSFLDTLEVKEVVDLQKKLYDIKRACGIFKENDIGEISGNCLNWIAKHFFELGMAVSNKSTERRINGKERQTEV